MSKPLGQVQTVVYTVEEAAKVLRVGKSKLYAQIGAGEVPHRRVCGRLLMTQADVDDVLEAGYRPVVA